MIAHDTLHATRTRALLAATAVLLVLLVLSGWRPYDRATWAMEVAPVVIALPLLWTTYRRFPLTTLLYACIFVHALVLMLGGAYTYARVPLGFQIAELFGLHRNPYDKIGHFFQGFVLAISATYEFIEWGAALALGQGADEFLGTQGDPWDTQSDMFFALLGAIAALVLFSRVHDRQIRQLDPPQGR